MRLPALVLSSCVLAVGCTDDLTAPYNYQLGTDSDTTTGDPLMVDCSDLGMGAVGATYMRTITASGGESPYSFSAPVVPDGLSLDQQGDLGGVPTMVGSNTIDVTVSDANGATAMASCPLDIGPQLAVTPLALDAVPYCLTGADTLLNHVAAGTGDGSPITCDTPGGSGNGKLPAGISVNADTCAIEGTTTETRLGTWAFVVRGTQSGSEVFMPYCVTQATPAAGTFDIVVDHTGMPGQTLVPLMRTFNPDAATMIGDGVMDPLFTITDMDSCGMNTCAYGYNYFINASPFDAMNGIGITSALLLDAMDRPIGFTHTFTIGGPMVTDEFKTRPWVVNLDWDYCLADTTPECADDQIGPNANGFLEFSVIMVPMPP
ncbi:MAG TPA: putative Ig domain-containing protein [Nannocystaceae bacterium]|nr:putative Ig domain-containing protein [Nannocystaceae bacterium]